MGPLATILLIAILREAMMIGARMAHRKNRGFKKCEVLRYTSMYIAKVMKYA